MESSIEAQMKTRIQKTLPPTPTTPTTTAISSTKAAALPLPRLHTPLRPSRNTPSIPRLCSLLLRPGDNQPPPQPRLANRGQNSVPKKDRAISRPRHDPRAKNLTPPRMRTAILMSWSSIWATLPRPPMSDHGALPSVY